jgi:hypothetical protein
MINTAKKQSYIAQGIKVIEDDYFGFKLLLVRKPG